jgi:hypothetical protein
MMKENLGLGLYAFLFMVLPIVFAFSCANEQAQRKAWQDCGGFSHEVCWDVEDYRACEYEFYMECINAEPS